MSMIEKEPFRFIMPSSDIAKKERIRHISDQFEQFLHLDAFKEFLCILDIPYGAAEDIYNALNDSEYNTRNKKGSVSAPAESQDAPSQRTLESLREALFPLYADMGLVTINKPRMTDFNRLLIFGGTPNSNFDKARCAFSLINSDTNITELSGLGSFRSISALDKSNVRKYQKTDISNCETEFDSIEAAFKKYSGVSEYIDREGCLNTAENRWRIRSYLKKDRFPAVRVFASPKRERADRAGTYDTCVHYFENIAGNDNELRILAITNNQYVNYQFIPLAMAMLESPSYHDHSCDIDVIGCSSDHELAAENTYTPIQYYGDIMAICEWICKFRKKFSKYLY